MALLGKPERRSPFRPGLTFIWNLLSRRPFTFTRRCSPSSQPVWNGGKGVDMAPTMPAFGHTLSPEEIWNIVSYVRTLHPYKGEKVKFTPDIDAARPRTSMIQTAEFEELFKSKTSGAEKEKQLAEK